MRTFSAVALAVALLVLVGGCRSMTGRSAGQVMDNKMTLASVKTKLAAEQIQNLTWVNVDTNEGVVYLTGNAKTPEAKAHATEIAQRVDGVERVVNDIHVTGTEQARSPAAPTSAAAASPASTGAAGSWSERWWRSTRGAAPSRCGRPTRATSSCGCRRRR